MTDQEINNLSGLELRAAVATEIFKLRAVENVAGLLIYEDGADEWSLCPKPVLEYESDHNAMMQVVEKMREIVGENFGMIICVASKNYIVDIFNYDRDCGICSDSCICVSAVSESLPVAVCRAALLFVSAQGESE